MPYRLLKNVNPPEGTVVHTAHQTKGRGQRGNRWQSDPANNVTASLIIKPTFLELKDQFFLYQIAGLACHDTLTGILNSRHYDIKIKWPNDLLIDGKKIAGVLIENNLVNTTINWSVVGIGINVNQQNFGGVQQATSLRLLTGNEIDVSNVLNLFCSYFEKYYLQLKSGKTEAIRQNYLRNLYGLNTHFDFESADGVKRFLVKGISDNGLLLLQNEHGKTIEADVKQLKWIY
jgi:BirA family biotin operon repressor/biotin-[acetyl-CoA-carboxylase] ligase